MKVYRKKAGEIMYNRENQTIERKESWRDEYLKCICGYCNAYGGNFIQVKMMMVLNERVSGQGSCS